MWSSYPTPRSPHTNRKNPHSHTCWPRNEAIIYAVSVSNSSHSASHYAKDVSVMIFDGYQSLNVRATTQREKTEWVAKSIETNLSVY